MNEAQFRSELERLFSRIEDAVDCVETTDIEVQRVDNVMTLEFESGDKLIVNSQNAIQEIWVAAPSGGFHFRQVDGEWRDTRSGESLTTALGALMSALAQERVEI